MDRQTIINAIQRAAAESGGVMPGRARFERISGITEGIWRGKYWLRWSDAVAKAGLTAGRMNEAHSEAMLLNQLAKLTLNVGHMPTYTEMRMARVHDPAFPNGKVFYRFGNKAQCTERLRLYCRDHSEFSAVADLLPAESRTPLAPSAATINPADSDGFVYMLKLGNHYKIGKTFAVPRRHRQISLELPERPDLVHKIATDDPSGTEAYWHRRFQSKQTNGEWFTLSAEDVRMFRRRRFM